MKTAIILHGTPGQPEYMDDAYPSSSNSHWLPWLQKQMLIAGYAAHTPEMPESYAPDYQIWAHEFERYQDDLNADSILVGHSCGGGFLLHWLSEHPSVRVARVVLVAPWLDPDASKCPTFFDFTIDPALTDRCDLHILNSDDDEGDIQESVRRIRVALPAAHYHEFKNHGHFTRGDMGTDAFTALRDIALAA